LLILARKFFFIPKFRAAPPGDAPNLWDPAPRAADFGPLCSGSTSGPVPTV
jgi:hypothetical protein